MYVLISIFSRCFTEQEPAGQHCGRKKFLLTGKNLKQGHPAQIWLDKGVEEKDRKERIKPRKRESKKELCKDNTP